MDSLLTLHPCSQACKKTPSFLEKGLASHKNAATLRMPLPWVQNNLETPKCDIDVYFWNPRVEAYYEDWLHKQGLLLLTLVENGVSSALPLPIRDNSPATLASVASWSIQRSDSSSLFLQLPTCNTRGLDHSYFVSLGLILPHIRKYSVKTWPCGFCSASLFDPFCFSNIECVCQDVQQPCQAGRLVAICNYFHS